MIKVIVCCILCGVLIACDEGDRIQAIPIATFEQAVVDSAAQVLDVRTAKEFQAGHLKHALHADWKNKQEFQERSSQLDKNKPVYIYCESGARSTAAAGVLADRGYRVIQLRGGLKAWKDANKPLERLPNEMPISLAEYKVITSLAPTVLVDIGADWCPPCRTMEPILNQLQAEMGSSYKTVRIDAGLQTELMQQVKAEKIPTFIIYKNGIEWWRGEGIIPITELKKQIK